MDYISSIGIKISNITAGGIPPSWLIWGMLVLLEDALPHIHHRGGWRAGWRLAPRWAVTEGTIRTSASISQGLANIPNEYAKWGKSALFSSLFSPTVPNSVTKVSLCEGKWGVPRWSAAVNHLDVLYINVCLLCGASACVFKDLNLKVKIIRAFCACIENPRIYCCLFMPVISGGFFL